MHKLARLSARERQQIIDDFVDETFADVDPQAPAMGIARSMRQLPAELPDDPTPEQVDAWVELAELAADPGFRQRVRSMALAGNDPRPRTQRWISAPSSATPAPWPRGSSPAHRRARPSWPRSSARTHPPRGGLSCSRSWRRSPTRG